MNADNDENLNAYMALTSWRKNFLSAVKIDIGQAFQESNFHMMAELAKDDPELFTLLREDLREVGVPLARLDMALRQYLHSEKNEKALTIGVAGTCKISIPADQKVQISFGNTVMNIELQDISFS